MIQSNHVQFFPEAYVFQICTVTMSSWGYQYIYILSVLVTLISWFTLTLCTYSSLPTPPSSHPPSYWYLVLFLLNWFFLFLESCMWKTSKPIGLKFLRKRLIRVKILFVQKRLTFRLHCAKNEVFHRRFLQ